MFYKAKAIGTILILLQVSAVATASEEREPQTTKATSVWIATDPTSGLTIAIPSVSEEELLSDIGAVQSALQAQQDHLAQIEEEKQFSVMDGIITAAMPGGMLYAVIRRQQHNKAVTQLNEVDSRLAMLDNALMEYKQMLISTTMVAIASELPAGSKVIP